MPWFVSATMELGFLPRICHTSSTCSPRSAHIRANGVAAGRGDMLLVALTGWGQATDRERTREAGFDSHIVKPVDAVSLAALIAMHPKSTQHH